MDVMGLPGPDSSSPVEAILTCERCFKSYQRRDLLMRHRRRCQGPKKLVNRRKACDACVQAKAKCCYTQPTCSRCSRRGTPCVYVTSPTASTSGHSEQRNEAAETPNSNLQPRMGPLATSNQPFDLELAAWDFSSSSYPLGSFDMALAEIPNSSLIPRQGFTGTELSVHRSPEFSSSIQALSQPPASMGVPVSMPLAASSSNNTRSSAASSPSSSAPFSVVHILSEYASLLTKSYFSSPFLHHSQYSQYSSADPDMTILPLTAMAICCASSISLSAEKTFFRRAMDAARERLIGSFPSYQCMQKWDALHSMLIFVCMDMKEIIGDESEGWKLTPPVKGLGSPFLLKMTESYLQSYPEIRNHDINVFSDPKSSPCSAATSQWARWRITETARRTIFFTNMVNFYSNYDHKTGKLSPYYEALNNDLILNMPLPCNHAAWLARDEESWSLAMKRHSPLAYYHSPDFNHAGNGVLSSESCLKNVLSKFTKQELQAEIGNQIGFSDSDDLRRFIILSAGEQFT
ncbi:hypothetical protein LI328DRAFT_167445 [Trichoderma asperelloides]|nr:hypothetical protein LI328DRAFT_167445 [Trichoderma asperelloides]